jgi:carbamoyltransferase
MGYMVAAEHRPRLAGVLGIDGSCRPQIVPEQPETLLCSLLLEVRKRIGVGAVLNTSFNIHGEPIACRPAEAIDVYERSGADALAIGPYLVRRDV